MIILDQPRRCGALAAKDDASACAQAGLFDMRTFDRDEYFYYDHPANGDIHEARS